MILCILYTNRITIRGEYKENMKEQSKFSPSRSRQISRRIMSPPPNMARHTFVIVIYKNITINQSHNILIFIINNCYMFRPNILAIVRELCLVDVYRVFGNCTRRQNIMP